jgi:glycosyltransferase involved in cell wall biosynthesis
MHRVALMTESDRIGGMENMILNLAVALREQGHVVELIGPGNGCGWLGGEFRKLGIPVHEFVLRHAVDPGTAWRLGRLCAVRRFSVLHSHMFPSAFYGGIAASLAGIPHVVTMHGDGEQTKVWRRRASLRWAFGRAHAVVAVSGPMRDQLREALGPACDQMIVVPNGVPLRAGNRDTVRAELGVADDELLVLSLASYSKRKAQGLLLEALRGLAPSIRWHAALAGPDEGAKAELEVQAGTLGGRAHLLGPRNDVGNLLAAADVFAMPSLWEGLPLAMLEAMFAGRAIVASDVGGIPEAVRDGIEGLLVPPGDTAALQSALTRLLTDAHLRERLAAAARTRAQQSYSVGAMAEAYVALYGPGVTP